MTQTQTPAQLTAKIARHNCAYYEVDMPTIPDFGYDALVRELRSRRDTEAAGSFFGRLRDFVRSSGPSSGE